MVSMQSEQLTRMERMLQANLSNTQMAPRTGVHQTDVAERNVWTLYGKQTHTTQRGKG